MAYKVVWAFSGPEGTFWTEVYHVASGTPFNIVTQAAGKTVNRLLFLSPQCSLEYIQASDLTTPKSSYRQYLRLPGTAPGGGAASAVGEADDCLIYKIFNAQNQYRFAFFRGAPKVQFNRNANGAPLTPAADASIVAFCQDLQTLGYGWLRVQPVNKIPAQIFSWNPIQTVTGAVQPGFANLTLSNPITLQNPPTIYISQQDKKLLPGLNGIWTAALVGNPPSQVIQIQYQVAGNAVIAQPKGRLRNYTLVFTAFAAAPAAQPMFDNFGSRKTRDLFSRGRRSPFAPGLRTLV
jgi:hypothetical protein